ncbi:amino acid ABC transporter permease [Yimella sp. cx-51]|uniref:amino acid ABC transporter permease n=1 Tax=Yimella sp. cx-51 TaxID=2770551 RepID=UPI00165D826B|nr:amino acid ABC transporter permease [Yimella sp. cx-51]MBC9955617.1 amino acid ABC transporter permease [Yimella sp. cx-51]QTH37807.1 amino acid ABC transporter permease [Yimella sp. cx-51]
MQYISSIASGIPYTLLVTVSGFLIGVVGGVPLALMRRSRIGLVRLIARSIIEIARGIPPIVWVFLIYFGLGNGVITVEALPAAIAAFGLISCAYLAEIYRGGLSSISAGQWEAGEALGMRPSHQLRDVVGPQVLRQSIPAAATYGVGLLKDSSIAFTIGVTDILFHADSAAKSSSSPMVPYLVAAAAYVMITIPCAWAARRADTTLRRQVAR